MFSWRRSHCHRTKIRILQPKNPCGILIHDLPLTERGLYQLSYRGRCKKTKACHLSIRLHVCLPTIKNLIRMPAPEKPVPL
jgi:hypothetical protein